MTRCFLIEHTGRCEYIRHWMCPTHGEREDHADEEFEFPHNCPLCGLKTTDAHTTMRREWVRPDTEQRAWNVVDFGPGAMFDAYWLPDSYKGQDGKSLSVILPDGQVWHIDSEASNCDRPGTDHDCWCRHGEPPMVTVDKNPEPGRATCAAGGGSIMTPNWHGFLRNGELVT